MIQPVNSNPPDNIPEPLPQQQDLWRAPARFGNVPVDAEPKGWDRRQGFKRHYPQIDLPTQIVDRFSLGRDDAHEPNRLIWGDNLHALRQIPTNSVDLIYIDPPFFSGREFNVIWGDNNELRSFNDIWEGGLDGYLIWLNARLYEMKRILKPTGSIYVHCDWHASHYIKVEMDKIFGYENFRREIVWTMSGIAGFKGLVQNFVRGHDILFYYQNGGKPTFNKPFIPYNEKQLARFASVDSDGRRYKSITKSRRLYLDEAKGVPASDVWADIANFQTIVNAPEKIGYPTQKPEALLERIIKASSNEGDVVLDAFVGGGTTAAAAMKLQRRFICIDQSRVAIAVTAERLKQTAITQVLEDDTYPDFTVEQWGIYEADNLAKMPDADFREFVLQAYGYTRDADGDGEHIHGWRNQFPIWVGESRLDFQTTAGDVRDFANAIRRTPQYRQDHLRDGIMLAWGFRADAVNVAEELASREEIDVNFVRLQQVAIEGANFRERIVGRSTDKADYSEFLTFIQPPEVDVAYRANGGRAVTFDAGDSVVVNSNAEIINVQWDFDYNGVRFSATQGYSFQKGSGKNKKPQIMVTHKFPRAGKFMVACRVQDSRGGEGMWSGEVEAR